MPLLRGKSIQNRPLYWHYPHYGNQGGEPSSIIMEGDWKLIHYHEDGRDELYHLGKDIGEQNNLITKQNKLAEQMRGKLDEWLKQANAKFPKPDECLIFPNASYICSEGKMAGGTNKSDWRCVCRQVCVKHWTSKPTFLVQHLVLPL